MYFFNVNYRELTVNYFANYLLYAKDTKDAKAIFEVGFYDSGRT